MTAQTNDSTNNLVLRLSGGQRDGETIFVATAKCLLRATSNDAADQNETQCSIFRGPNGVAVRSHCDNVRVNGVASTVHWLKENDRIELSDSVFAEVEQLGSFNGQESPEPAVDNATCQTVTVEAIAQPTTDQPVDSSEAQRLQLIEDQIEKIQSANQQSNGRFDNLESRIDSLSEQITKLVELAASNGTQHEPTTSQQDTPASLGVVASTPSTSDASDDDEEEVFFTLPSNEPADDCEEENETIVAFDPESPSESEPTEAVENVEIKLSEAEASTTETTSEAPAESEPTDSASMETDPRRLEMERIFGRSVMNAPKSEPATAETQDESTSEVSSEDESNVVSTVSEQSPESLLETSHSHNEEVASLTETTTETETSDSVDDSEEESSSTGELFSSHLLADDEQDEETADEPTEEETATDSPRNESVAELLARMKAAGTLPGASEYGDSESESSTDEPSAEQEIPAPVQEPVAEESGSDNPDDDVNDYMSKLLNRMRGGAPAVEKTEVSQPAKTNSESKKKESDAETFAAPVNPLKPEEFVPSQKAKKIQSFAAMRELANGVARTNVQSSEEGRRRKALGSINIAISGISFLIAVYYLLGEFRVLFDTPFIIGTTCLAVAGVFCYRFYATMRYNEMIDKMPAEPQEQNDEEKLAETPENETESDA